MKMEIKLKVNGVDYEMWIKPYWILLNVLREETGESAFLFEKEMEPVL